MSTIYKINFIKMGCCSSDNDKKKRKDENANDQNVQKNLEEAFRKFDKDGNGGLDPEQTEKFLNYMMEGSNQKISQNELRHFMKQIDVNGDGLL